MGDKKTTRHVITGPVQQPRPSWFRSRAAKWPLLLSLLVPKGLLAYWVAVVTTRGRVSGKARKTPLWYVREGDSVCCFSGWGGTSDWLRNLQSHPKALVSIGRKSWETEATIIEDPSRTEYVLSLFRKKYGWMVPVLYHMDLLILVTFRADGQGE